MDNKTLKAIFYEKAKGREILKCIQCGTCSGSCPMGNCMDHGPREIFALIRDGEMTTALKSNTPWFCSSCYQCLSRCPKEIPVTDLMYTLKEMALKFKLAPQPLKINDLYQTFVKVVEERGRITESLLMARYGLKHPLDMLKNTPVALKLLQKKRLEAKFQKTSGKPDIARWTAGRLAVKDSQGGSP